MTIQPAYLDSVAVHYDTQTKGGVTLAMPWWSPTLPITVPVPCTPTFSSLMPHQSSSMFEAQ